MDKETLSNYGWIVILVLVLAVLLALATPFGNFISDAIWSTANGLFNTNENALEAGINGILGKEDIVVDGLGEITIQNPNDAEFEYDEETGILIGTTPLVPVEPEDLTDVIPMIEFTAGTFESNTEYTPGQYEFESYEVTKTRTKKPVACNGGIILSCTYVGDGTFQDNQPTPDYVDHASTYIAYCVARSGDTTVNGFVPYHLNYRTIANTADDTLENAIYIAAYTQEGTNIDWKVAKWDGSKYVDVNCRTEIDAITEFTETYTETVSKTVIITKPSSSTTLVYLPSGTMKAEKGMTWAEWLASDYNTFGADTTSVWDSDYNEVALDSEIVAGASYGFLVKDTNNSESVISFPLNFNDKDISDNASFAYEMGADWDGIYTKVGNIDSYDDWIGITISMDILEVNQTTSSYCFTYEDGMRLDDGSAIFVLRDSWVTGYMDIACLIVVDPNSWTDLGLAIPEPGFYIWNTYLTSGGQVSSSYKIEVDLV